MAAPRNNIPIRPRTTARSPNVRVPMRVLGAMYARPRTTAALLVGLTAAIVTTIVFAVWPSGPSRYEPPIRARQYSAYTACLLTDSLGIASAYAKPVWSAMQTASTSTTAQVSYLAIQGDTTAANADTYLNTLALRGCNLIVTVGLLPDQTVRDRAAAFPKQRFAVVDPANPLPSNATAIDADGVAGLIESSFRTWKNSR